MSYTLHIWESPAPANHGMALDTVFDRGAEVVGQTEAFLTLAKRLTARYPCLCVNGAAVWSDGPLDGITDERVFALGITHDIDQVSQFVRATAASLGLHVYDMQRGLAYLPDGGVMEGDAAASAAKPEVDEPDLGVDEVRDVIYDGLMEVLRPYGFKRRYSGTQDLVLLFPGGWFRVVAPIVDWAPLYRVSVFVQIRLDEVVALTQCIERRPKSAQDEDACGIVRYVFFSPEREHFEIRARHDLCAAIAEIGSLMSTTFIEALGQCRDYASFDKLINPADDSQSMLAFDLSLAARVIVARFAGNPAYAEIAARGVARLKGLNHVNSHREAVKIDALLAYLRNYDPANPAPLPDNPGDDLAGFIAQYDGSQVDHICCKPSPEGARYFEDANDTFRFNLQMESKVALKQFPIDLVRDMLVAEARVAALNGGKATSVPEFVAELLRRSGEDALQMLAQHLRQDKLDREIRDIPAELAARMALACSSRLDDPRFEDQAEAYAALCNRFNQIVAVSARQRT